MYAIPTERREAYIYISVEKLIDIYESHNSDILDFIYMLKVKI